MTTQIDDDDFDDFESAEPSAENNQMTITELYETLILQTSVIITVTAFDAKAIRAGITSIKGKENSKLKRQGLPIDPSRLEFIELACDKKGFIRLQISLIGKKAFTIASIETAGD